MALFGPKDENLPWLTHVYQLAPVSADADEAELLKSELYVWLYRMASGWPAPPTFDMAHLPFTEEDWGHLRIMARAVAVIRRLMDALADTRRVDESDMFEARLVYLQTPFIKKVGELRWARPGADGLVDPRTVERTTAARPPFDLGITANLFAELFTLMKTPEVFRRCEECGSVFQSRRGRPRFCSQRCVGTNGQRERRHSKKSEAVGI